MDWQKLSWLVLPASLLAAPACQDSVRDLDDDASSHRISTGSDEVEVSDDSDAAADEEVEEDGTDEEVEEDPADPEDAGADEEDAGEPDDIPSDGTTPRVISAPEEVTRALCSDAYDSVQLSYSNVTRGSWQYNPGGTFMTLSAPGYPCAAFLEEKKSRPAVDNENWTDAADGAFVGFSEPSQISSDDYMSAQFRYFRSFVYVPSGAALKELTLKAQGIDDSVYVELSNSRYPQGISPQDIGPADPQVGACQGNGHADWNLASYIVEGEINQVLLVHADLAAKTSTLMSVELRADGAPIQLVSCKQ